MHVFCKILEFFVIWLQVFYSTVWFWRWYGRVERMRQMLEPEFVRSLSSGWAMALENAVRELFPDQFFQWSARGVRKTTRRPSSEEPVSVLALPPSIQAHRMQWLGLLAVACSLLVDTVLEGGGMHIRGLPVREVSDLLRWCKTWLGSSSHEFDKWRATRKYCILYLFDLMPLLTCNLFYCS